VTSVLTLRIVDPWLIVSLCVASAAVVVFLLLRRRPAPWPLWAAAALFSGGALTVLFALVARATRMFGMPLPWQVVAWGAVGMAAIAHAIANLWKSRWGRKAIDAGALHLLTLTPALGINP
jgi:hypothetical protein